jgi:plastocyanin
MRRTAIAALIAPALLLIALSAAPATQAGGGCHGGAESPPGDGEASVVKIDGCMFFPTVARVPVGTTVRFLNTGLAPHNVTGVVGTWGSDELPSGAEYRNTFSAPGVYPFACTLHPGMNGAIVVGEVTAAAAELTTTSQPPRPEPLPAADPVPIVIVGLAALGFGVLLGVVATRVMGRDRTIG